MPTGIAIFGAGRWGTNLIRTFLAEPRAVVLAIADPFPQSCQRVIESFELPADCCVTQDWRVALETPGLEAVVVATPAETHQELIEAALKQGLHVLAEKPITLQSETAADLWMLSQRVGRQLVVDHTYLFHPIVAPAQAAIQAGSLGRLRYGYASRTNLGPIRQDVDALWDLAIHDLALFYALVGELPCRVQAQGQVWLQPHLRTDLSPQGLADTVWATLTYPSGFQAQCHWSWLNPDKQRRLTIVGDGGSLVFDELAAQPLMLHRGSVVAQGPGWVPDGLSNEAIAVPATQPLQQVCAHFLDCVEQQQPSTISSGWVGGQLVAVLEALSESLGRKGQVIELP
jgi:predicted dehydrogenase